MLDHVRVNNVRALKSAVLKDLGRINIISGPNNSGKSTLLSGLADQKHRARATMFDAAAADEIVRKTVGGTGWGGAGHPTENSIYSSIIRGLLTSRPWYEDEGEVLSGELSAHIKNNAYLNRWHINVNPVVHEFQKTFGTFPATVLVPPKRSIELVAPIATDETVHPNGRGLLNHLFAAKNQPSGTDARRLYDRVAAVFTSISNGYVFDIFVASKNEVRLQFSRRSGPWIEAEQCGLGLQDLLVLLYFAFEPKSQLLLIEEPESHIHPDMQRRLLVSLRNDTAKQYVFTSHSNIFLNNALIDRVFSTQFDGTMIAVSDETARASLLDDLGYSVADNLVSDLIVLVEGPSDVAVLEELFVKYGLYRMYEIKAWPLGGDIMDQVDLSVLAERYRVVALIDRDPKSAKVRKRFEKRCKEQGIPVHRLTRYSIENYFPLTALRAVFGSQVPATVTALDPAKKVEDQLGFNIKNNNRKLARATALSDMAGTDLEGFLIKVEELCRQAKTA